MTSWKREGAEPRLAGLTVRGYRESDDEGLVALFQRSFDRWPKHDLDVTPLDHLRWKLRSVAEGRTERPLIAEVGGQIVGASCGIALPVRVDRRDYVASTASRQRSCPSTRERAL